MSRFVPAILAGAAVLVAACEPERPSLAIPPPVAMDLAPPAAPEPEKTNVTLADVGLDAGALDRSVDPCTDFYQFACGGWIKKTALPGDQSRYVRSFSVINDRNEAELKSILEHAALAKSDPTTQKIGAYYAACMDEAAVEKAGTKPIKPLLKLARGVHDEKTLEAAIAELHKRHIWVLFDVSDRQDDKDATQMIGEIDQNGLGLPNKEYYAGGEDEKQKREKYEAHVARMLVLGGYSKGEAKSAAADVLKVETAIAALQKSPRERRDPKTMFNRVDREGLVKLAPGFDWAAYFKGIGAPDLKAITITSPAYFEGLGKLLHEVKPAEWRNYLAFHVLRDTADLLGKAFLDESFALRQVLSGQKEIEPRWKRCVRSSDAALGELVAQPFVAKHFTPDSKATVERFVSAISQAFRDEVDTLAWMDPATKAHAKTKLEAMRYLIGYPEKWRSYDFDVKPDTFAENALAARAFDLKFTLGKIGKPVDRGEWHMTPPTVNAYYTTHMNHMVFPAGILQPPFYDPKASVPVNVGAIGMVVGHELTHGFDDRGAQFDEKGNFVDWWSPGVGDGFRAKTACIADEYSGFEVLPGVHVDGKLTLAENIADNAGLKLAFAAYRALRKGAAEVMVADGFTEDQQFFLGAAQAWCTVQTDDSLRLRVKTDTHSPSKARIDGSLSNLAAFADAFSCKEGTPMRRTNACDVW